MSVSASNPSVDGVRTDPIINAGLARGGAPFVALTPAAYALLFARRRLGRAPQWKYLIWAPVLAARVLAGDLQHALDARADAGGGEVGRVVRGAADLREHMSSELCDPFGLRLE